MLNFAERGDVFPVYIHSVNINISYDTSRSGKMASAKTSSMFSFRDQQRHAAEYIAERERAQASAADEYQAKIFRSDNYWQKWRLLAQHREVEKSDLVRVSAEKQSEKQPKVSADCNGNGQLGRTRQSGSGVQDFEALARDGAHGMGCPRYLESKHAR